MLAAELAGREVRLGGFEPEQAGQAGCGRCQQRGSLGLARADQQRLEQLTGDAQAELLIQLTAARRQYPEAGGPGQLACGPERGGLADPGRPFDQQHARLASRRRGYRLGELSQLGRPLQQRGRARIHAAHQEIMSPRLRYLTGLGLRG